MDDAGDFGVGFLGISQDDFVADVGQENERSHEVCVAVDLDVCFDFSLVL